MFENEVWYIIEPSVLKYGCLFDDERSLQREATISLTLLCVHDEGVC